MTRTGERLEQYLTRVANGQRFVVGDRVVFIPIKKIKETREYKNDSYFHEFKHVEKMQELNRSFEIREFAHGYRETSYKLNDVDEDVDIRHRETYEELWFPDSWLKKAKKKRSVSERELEKLLKS